jgi:YD repeat-containing protein
VRFLAVPRGDLAMAYGVEGSEIAYSTPGAATSATTYDEHERPVEVSFHDAEHALISRIVLARDRDGRLLSEINHFEGERPRFDHQTGLENVPPEDRAKLDSLLASVFERQTLSSTTYAYDQNGRVLQRTQNMGRLSDDRTTYRYDERGNPIEETTSSEHRSVNIDDDGVVHPTGAERLEHIVRYHYKYDSHGNWTERVVRSRASAGEDFRHTNVTWRTIAYYGP